MYGVGRFDFGCVFEEEWVLFGMYYFFLFTFEVVEGVKSVMLMVFVVWDVCGEENCGLLVKLFV